MTNAIIKRYKEQRDLIRKEFESEKVGNQTQFTDQLKLFKPLIESQKETSKDLQDKLVSNQNTTNLSISNALVPFTNELKRRNDQVDELQALPFYTREEDLSHSTPKSKDKPQSGSDKVSIMIDINGELLNQTHIENLVGMNFELPSIVQENGTMASTLERITSKKRSLSQLTGKTGQKRSEAEKEMYQSQKDTLEIYERKIKKLLGVSEFIVTKSPAKGSVHTGKGRERKLCKQKRGKGRPRKYPETILYNSANDLCQKLDELVAAKRAGNTGLDNSINSILDELLNIGAVDKDFYNNLFKHALYAL